MALKSPNSLLAELASLLIPPPPLTLTEWADEHFVLSEKNSGNPGKWKTRPYQVDILNAITDPRYWRVTVMKSARVGYTKCLNVAAGYHMAHDPCPMSLIQPTVGDAEDFSRDEINSLIEDVPAIRALFQDRTYRDSTNNLLQKHFPGGIFTLFGANSPGGFRRITRRVMLLDEVDGYPAEGAGKEGDQLALAINRTIDFWNRCIVEGSTPTIEDFSRIERSYKASDQQKRFLPCPHCGHMQYLVWRRKDKPGGFYWERGKPDTAVYICESCEKPIQHKEKREMDKRGEWRPTVESGDPGHIGFHIWAAYSPQANATWSHLVRAYESSKGDMLQYQTWVNTWQGETWKDDASTRLTAEGLMSRVDKYHMGQIPEGVLMLTCGVDVQDDRIEISTWGWGRGSDDGSVGAEPEGWLIDHTIIKGLYTSPTTWGELDKLLGFQYEHPFGGKIGVSTMLVDSGDGEHSSYVYEYANKHRMQHVYASKGTGTENKPIIGRGSKTEYDWKGRVRKTAALVFMVGTDVIKTRLSGRLRYNTQPGPGALHFPSNTSQDYFDQLTSEKQSLYYQHGAPRRRWVRKRGARAETLDCAVYAYAALYKTLERFNRRTIWDTMEARLRAPEAESVKLESAKPRSAGINVLNGQ